MAKTDKGPDAFILKMDHIAPGLNGLRKFVHWYNGRGVLDRFGFAGERPDLCDGATLKWRGDDLLPFYRDYWKGKGAKVETVTEKAANEYRAKLQKDPTAHLEKDKPEKAPAAKAKPKSKTAAKPPHVKE